MARWQDLIGDVEDFSHTKDVGELRKIVTQLASVANKRLRLLESHNIKFSEGTGAPDEISGVRRFGVKQIRRKSRGEQGRLISEYKRVKGFLESKISTMSGRIQEYYEFASSAAKKRDGEKISKAQARRDYLSSTDEADAFDKLSAMFQAMREGNWLSQSPQFPRNYDSHQLKAYFMEVITYYKDASFDELVDIVKKEWKIDKAYDFGKRNESDDVGTSGFMIQSD